MKVREIVKTDYFKLFVKREGKVVLGKHYSSLWLLCCVMTATFLAIAFSNASLDYLAYKMDDPFIQWVDIHQGGNPAGDYEGFEMALKDDNIKEQYHIISYSTDKYFYSNFYTANSASRNLRCRYFEEIRTPLVAAILDKDNVVGNYCIDYDNLDAESYGVIITQDALFNKLGYKDVPAYINYMEHCPGDAAAEFCIDINNDGTTSKGEEFVDEEDYYESFYDDTFVKAPIPVLAVVKRLPTNMDIIGTKFFYEQELNYALSFMDGSNMSSFIYFIPSSVNKADFTEYLLQVIAEHTEASVYTLEDDLYRMKNLYDGAFVSVYYDYEDDVDFAINKQINDKVLAKYASKGVERIYRYKDVSVVAEPNDYISIRFDKLDEISAFQVFAKDNYKVDIEMSQITAKENFNEVTIMANILSWTMIVFAIVCITLFIVNLLQSYFQKVKRNLGTFKAFGISNYDLITIYVLIMVAIIIVSVVTSLLVTWLLQELLPLLGIYKEGSFGYLSLWSAKTVASVFIIIMTSVYTVYKVMRNLLKATPGDLIYDR